MKLIGGTLAIALLFSTQVFADQMMTADMVRQVIEATDVAAKQRDTQAIGVHLGSDFFKYIDLPYDDVPLAIEMNKQQYLEHIDQGWGKLEAYQYVRQGIVINIARDGQSAESFSTITETFKVDGKEMISKVREYASFVFENGQPIIIRVEGIVLTGDTTPK
ncbi:hypothetical protein ACFL3A_14925 [Pseudomonadota bacterium]